mgnify:CR=1 FL=1
MDEQTEALRLHAIEAYRASKRGGGGGGGDFHGAAVGECRGLTLNQCHKETVALQGVPGVNSEPIPSGNSSAARSAGG